ncbi:hypothetical protein MMC13_006665 [Lambiella insularis]|nr:hypothetical protein [Lambiella insularis]
MALSPPVPLGQVLCGSEKIDEVTRLLNVLELDLKEKNLLPPKRNATLEELKIHTRSVDDADPMLTERVNYNRSVATDGANVCQGINILCQHSFKGNSLVTARSALKCLANVMLLEPSTRQKFVDLGWAPKAAERIKNDNRDDEFLGSRLLFLTTYETNLDFEDLFENHQLAESINTNLARHAKVFSKAGPKSPVPLFNVLALSETLKLLFNLTQYYPDHAPTFTKSLLHILKILANIKIPVPPLQPPITYLINSLLNLDLEDKKAGHFMQNPLFPKFDPNSNADRLIKILDSGVRQYKAEQLEQVATPLVSLIRKIYGFAPDTVKLHVRFLLLPSNEERAQPLGKSDTLSAHLLRLSTSAVAPGLRETVSNFLFELSDRDATSFVRNVGYGFASGFLLTHDLPVPENALEAWSTNADDDTEALLQDPGERVTNINGVEINPVTGQRRDKEPLDSGAEMTQEEKEREAERLFVLFERLRATGVVNVQNPVTKAMHESRFEEIE